VMDNLQIFLPQPLSDTMIASYWYFNNITVAHTGGYALWLNQGCTQNVIQRSHFYDLGAGGVRIGPGISGEQPTRALLSTYNTLNNSVLEDGGHVYQM